MAHLLQCYNHLALLRGLQGRWAESLRLIEEAEEQADPKPETLANKGVALWKLGRPQEALPFLQEAARRLPPQPDDNLHLWLRACRTRQGQGGSRAVTPCRSAL